MAELRAVIYARYSSSSQREESIEGQVKECTAYAERNGYSVIGSVIYGLLGMMILNPIMFRMERSLYAGDSEHQYTGGANMLCSIIVLAIMILPTVISVSTSSLKAVSDSLRAASLALGATKEQTIFKTVIPAAKSGILTGIVLGIGRALGEAMAINMVAGGAVNIPLPFNSVRTLTTQRGAIFCLWS